MVVSWMGVKCQMGVEMKFCAKSRTMGGVAGRRFQKRERRVAGAAVLQRSTCVAERRHGGRGRESAQIEEDPIRSPEFYDFENGGSRALEKRMDWRAPALIPTSEHPQEGRRVVQVDPHMLWRGGVGESCWGGMVEKILGFVRTEMENRKFWILPACCNLF